MMCRTESTVTAPAAVSSVDKVISKLKTPLDSSARRTLRFVLPYAKRAVASREECKVRMAIGHEL